MDIPRPGRARYRHFFRKGTCSVPAKERLRRTADRVDDQMREFRDTQGRREKVWHTRDNILLCVGRSYSGSEKLVRTPLRLAARLGAATGMRSMWKPPATGCRKTSAAPFCAAGVAQELGAEPLPWPIRPKSVRCCAPPVSITSQNHHRPPQQQRWKLRGSFADRLGRWARISIGDRRAGERRRTAAARQGITTAASTRNGACSCASGCAVAVALCADHLLAVAAAGFRSGQPW